MSIVPGMIQLSRRRIFLLGGLVLAAGCADRREVPAVDSALMRDLTLAGSETPAPSSAVLGDTATSTNSATVPLPAPSPTRTPTRSAQVPARVPSRAPARVPTPAPSVPAPAPAPTVATAPVATAPAAGTATSNRPGAGTGRRSLGSGTTLVGRTDAQICSIANRPGDRFVATLTSDVTGADGARIPAGTPILVEMATPSADSPFAFRVKAVQVDGTLIPIEGSVRAEGTPTERRVSKGGDKGKVVTGAVAGAILGRVLGGGTKGTIIGAAGGAAAGTIAAARNSVTEYCLPAGATLTVTLSAPLVLTQGVP